MPFPKRSAPKLFTPAPLGSLMPPPEQRHWWVDLQLSPPSYLQHAERIIKCRCSASWHTMKNCRISCAFVSPDDDAEASVKAPNLLGFGSFL